MRKVLSYFAVFITIAGHGLYAQEEPPEALFIVEEMKQIFHDADVRENINESFAPIGLAEFMLLDQDLQNNEIFRANLGQAECSDGLDSIYLTFYDTDWARIINGLDASEFYYGDFPEFDNSIRPGMLKDELKKLLGTPAYEDETLVVYGAKDMIEMMYSGTDEIYYFYPYRFYFKDAKLWGIWLYDYLTC